MKLRTILMITCVSCFTWQIGPSICTAICPVQDVKVGEKGNDQREDNSAAKNDAKLNDETTESTEDDTTKKSRSTDDAPPLLATDEDRELFQNCLDVYLNEYLPLMRESESKTETAV